MKSIADKLFNSPMGSGQKLSMVAAFYKNDKPNGIGFTLTEEALDRGIIDNVRKQLRELELFSKSPNGSNDVDIKICHFELKQMGEARDKFYLSDLGAILSIANILWLQHRGALVNDDFNGVISSFKSVQPKQPEQSSI